MKSERKSRTLDYLKSERKIRLFAEFKDKDEYKFYLDSLYKSLPKKYHFDLAVFLGRFQSTIIKQMEVDK